MPDAMRFHGCKLKLMGNRVVDNSVPDSIAAR